MATLWIVMDSDYADGWPVAAYSNEAMAEAHAKEMGLYVSSVELLEALPAECTDRSEIDKRTDERMANEIKAKKRKLEDERRWQNVQDQTPTGKNLRLRHCQTFLESPMWTAHGYCQYCGGWAPPVVRKHCGDAYLADKISELELSKRQKMLALVGI